MQQQHFDLPTAQQHLADANQHFAAMLPSVADYQQQPRRQGGDAAGLSLTGACTLWAGDTTPL
jgi:hypothetical protein